MAFLVHWIYPYGLPIYLLMDNSFQFISTFFEHGCSAFGLKHGLTTEHQPQTYGEA